MNLHPNWVALASIDFPRKIFIQEGKASNQGIAPVKKLVKETLNGNDVKDFYLDVVSTPSNILKKTPKSIDAKKNVILFSSEILNTSDERRITVFLQSAQNNKVSLVREFLLKFPYLLNSTDCYGWTALMCAVKSSAVDVVKCLLEHKADKYLKEKSGKTAFSLAAHGSVVESILLIDITDNCEKYASIKKSNPKTVNCELCNEHYSLANKKKHLSSTMHIFQSGKRNLPTRYGIPESNKGFQLLLKTGWNTEMGLGVNGEGCKFPVKSVFKLDRFGLGNNVGKAKVTHFPANDLNAIKYRTESYRTLNKKEYIKKLMKEKNCERNIRYELS